MRFSYKIPFIIIGMLTCSLAGFASPGENSVHGKILDDAGHPLIGAIVTIPDLHTGTVTDNNGAYELAHLPKGKYVVQVRMLGYSNLTQTLMIDGVVEMNAELKESIIEKNEVIITGSSLATRERTSVVPIQSIRVKEMHENAYTNVIDAIAKLPGVSQVSTGPAISKPVIRGLGYNRIITMSDGVRQEGQQWGDEHGIEIDDYNVSRIEVLKGPASLAYGSDALAGVINIISDEPMPLGKIKGGLTSNYQTNSGLFALNGQLGGNIKGYSWNVYATGKQAHDYKNRYDGYVFNSRFNNMDYGGTMGLNRKWGYSKLSFTSFGQDLGIAEGDRDSATGKFLKVVNNEGLEEVFIVEDADGKSYKKQIPAQRIEHKKLAWNNSIYLKNSGRIGITLGYQQSSRREFENVLATEESGLWFLLQTYTYDVKYFFPVWNGWQATAGVNGMQQHNSNRGIEFLVPDYKLSDAGLYVIAKKDWDKWSVSGGLRFNYRAITASALYLDSTHTKTEALVPGGYEQFGGFTKEYSNAVWSIGTSYSVNKRTIFKLNIASGYRAPNIAELSANGVHEGTIRYEYGNTALKPENSLQADLGLSWNSEHLLVNASVFYNYITSFIYLQKLVDANGNDSVPAAHNEEGYTAFMYRQTNAGLYGGEAYVDFHPHPFDWLHLENTFSYVKGMAFNATDSARNLPNIPAARWLIEVRAQKNNLTKWMRNVYAKVGLETNFAQNSIFSAYSTETTTPGYSLLNAGIGVDFTNRKHKTLFTLNIAGQNLTDKTYQNHLSRLKYAPTNNLTGRNGIYGMGRNISIVVNIPLELN